MSLLINYDVFLSMKVVFIVATSVDPDFMYSLFTFSHLAQILLIQDDLFEIRLKVSVNDISVMSGLLPERFHLI